MKIGYRSAWHLFLSLPLIFCLCSLPGAGAADPVESLFPEFGGLVEPFHGRAPGAEVLLYSATQDPFPMGCLALGAKPSLDLIDPLALNEFVHAVNYENAGGMGAINISIIY